MSENKFSKENKANPMINLIKDESEFKKELGERLKNLEIGESLDVCINGEMKHIKKESEKKVIVSASPN